MQRFKIFSILLALSVFTAGLLRAEIKELVILNTSDIHSYIRNHDRRKPGGILELLHLKKAPGKKDGGWLKLASMIKEERKKAGGKENVLLIDCGDTIQGTLSGAVSQGQAGVNMLNLLDYDVWVIGNHEFDFGLKRLEFLCGEARACPLAANTNLVGKAPHVKAWKIFNRNGIKTAVIGLTLPELSNRFADEKIRAESISKTLDKYMPEIERENPDIIIMAIHAGLYLPPGSSGETLYSIASKYPGIDIILGGHTHQDIPGKKIGVSTWYAQAGCHAHDLLKLRVEVDTKKNRVTSIKSRLLPVKRNTPEDPECSLNIREWLEKADEYSSRHFGKTAEPVTSVGKNKYNCGISELINRAMAEASGAQASVQGIIRKNCRLKGEIKGRDIFAVSPYEDTIYTMDLKTGDLKKIIDEQLAKYRSGYFLSPWNLYINLAPGNKKVMDIRPAAAENSGTKRIKTAFNGYNIAGAGGRFTVLKKIAENPENNLRNTGIKIRKALEDYIVKNSPLDVKPGNWIKQSP